MEKPCSSDAGILRFTYLGKMHKHNMKKELFQLLFCVWGKHIMI